MAREGSGLQRSLYTTDEVLAAGATAAVAEVGPTESLPLTVSEENEDFTFSESLEGDDVAENSKMDDEDGVTANWSSGIIKPVRVVAKFDVAAGSGEGALENTLTDLMVYVNEQPQVSSDEGFSDIEDATVEYNIDDVIFVKGGDTIRLVLVGDAEAASADFDIPANGEFALLPAN